MAAYEIRADLDTAYLEGYNEAMRYNIQRQRKRRQRAAQRRYERKYFAVQKLWGLGLTAMGIATPFILDGDATASLLMLPLGLTLMLSKKHLLTIMGHTGDF